MATIVALAGSQTDNRFAVIDFTNPASPSIVLITPPFQGGCAVDCSNTWACIGNNNGNQIAIYDISNPASPTLKGSVTTSLSGIGAISLDGAHLVAADPQSVVYVDITNPSIPTVLSTFMTGLISISQVALKGTTAVVSAQNSDFFISLNYSNPAAPVEAQSIPGNAGITFQGAVTCDLSGTTAVLADSGGGNIYDFSLAGGISAVTTFASAQTSGIDSISIDGATVAASSNNDVTVSLVSFQNPSSPSEATFPAGLGGPVLVKLSGGYLFVCGIVGVNTIEAALFSVSGTTATKVNSVAVGIISAASIGMTTFFPSGTQPSGLIYSPSRLDFGTILVGSTSPAKTFSISNPANAGTPNIDVSVAKPTETQFVASPLGFLQPIGPGITRSVQVTFTPTAAQSYSTDLPLIITTPSTNLLLPMTGKGGFPKAVIPAALDFNSVPVCVSHPLSAYIQNTGPVDMIVSNIAISGSNEYTFAVIGTSIQVPAGGSNFIPVTFKPTTIGPASGILNFSTDDPTTPQATVGLSGTGTPEPPPTVSVSPTAVNFGGVPLQYFAGIAVTVANTGPCEDLIISLAITGTDFLLTTGDPTTVPTTTSPIQNVSIPHSTSNSYTIIYAPTSTNIVTGTLTITTNDPANPTVTVPLRGQGTTTSPAAIELILDRSGSMATAIAGGTRMTALQNAVAMFAQLLIPGTGFELGSVQFDSAEGVLTPLADFDATQQSAIIAGANTLFPRTLTSIGGGLQLGQSSLSTSTEQRKVAIVFTDGYENTVPFVAAVEPSILNAGTEVYAVGLGDPAYLSGAILQELAASSSGKFFQTTDPLVLRKQFVEILAGAFKQGLATDPILDLQQGQIVTVPVEITTCESRISFVVLWEDFNAQVQFSVRAPDGTTFRTGASKTNRLVRESQQPGYRFFQIAFPPGPNGNIGPAQVGTWEMMIDPVFLSDTTRAATTVLVEGKLQLLTAITASSVGETMTVSVDINHAATAVTGAKVSVDVTAPTASLAAIQTPAVIARAKSADTSLIPRHLQRITETCKECYQAVFDSTSGLYTVSLPPPVFDGIYSFEVNATGNACGGVFQRYWSGSIYVAQQPVAPPPP